MCAWRLLLLAALPALAGVGAGEVLQAREPGPGFLPARRAVTAAPGGSAALACRVAHLGDKAVSWVRARDLQILTHAGAVFSADPRVEVAARAEADGVTHTLRLAHLRVSDAGRYECQLNTEPKLSQIYNLTVTDDPPPALSVRALGPGAVRGAAGGAATLGCTARLQPAPPAPPALRLDWHRAGEPLNERPGGGVSVDTERSPGRVTSRLTLSALTAADAGPYRCRVSVDRGAGEGGGEDEDAPRGQATVTLVVDDTEAGESEAMQRDQAARVPGAAALPPARPPTKLALLAALLALAGPRAL